MANIIFGTIRDTASGGAPVKGLRVRAWDEDWPDGDDFMGQSITGASGGYQISYQHAHWDRAIGGLPSWRPDIYATVDIKNAKGDWVHIAKSQVFRDHNLDNDLVINFEVSLRPLVSVRTAFDPMKDGFHFNNLFIVEPDILGVDLGSWKMGFCGGMCSGALDRFRKGAGVPPDKSAPPDGDLLHEELMKRQIIAMSPDMLPMMYDWQSAPNEPKPMRKTSIAKRTADEWPKIQLSLDNDQPVILVLIRSKGYLGNPTMNHQVLAIGYDYNPGTKDLVVYTYDPNQHDKTNTLSLNIGLPGGKLYLRDSASRSTRGFFLNPVGERATNWFDS